MKGNKKKLNRRKKRKIYPKQLIEYFKYVPKEIVIYIFSFLSKDVQSIKCLALVCKRFLDLICQQPPKCWLKTIKPSVCNNRKEIEKLLSLPRFSHLINLTIYGYENLKDIWNIIWNSKMYRDFHLKVLDFSDNLIKDEGGKIIKEPSGIKSSIEELNLSRNDIGLNGINSIMEILEINSSLRKLNLSGNGIGDKLLKTIVETLKVNIFLKKLNLECNKIGGVVIAQLIKVNIFLENLNLSHNPIGDKGGKEIATALKMNSSLTILKLQGINIGSEGAETIAEALKINCSLKNLDLAYNNIGPEAAKAIAEMLKINETLRKLDITRFKGETAIRGALKLNKVFKRFVFL